VTMRSSVVDQNYETGVSIGGSDVTIESTIVRGTLPEPTSQQFGRGVVLHHGTEATLRSVVIEQNGETGLMVAGAKVAIDAALVQDTQPQVSDQRFGRGIQIQKQAGVASPVAITRSLVRNNFEFGISVVSSETTIDTTVVERTRPQALKGVFGDGVTVW